MATNRMKALQIERHGGPEVMQLAEVPVPEPGPGEVRVRMEASGLKGFLPTSGPGSAGGSDVDTIQLTGGGMVTHAS